MLHILQYDVIGATDICFVSKIHSEYSCSVATTWAPAVSKRGRAAGISFDFITLQSWTQCQTLKGQGNVSTFENNLLKKTGFLTSHVTSMLMLFSKNMSYVTSRHVTPHYYHSNIQSCVLVAPLCISEYWILVRCRVPKSPLPRLVRWPRRRQKNVNFRVMSH